VLMKKQVGNRGAKLPTISLANGVEMPMLIVGMGPWCSSGHKLRDHPCYNDSLAASNARLARKVGIRAVDTAFAYANQIGIGIALKDLPRRASWVTSKIPACSISMDLDSCVVMSEMFFNKTLLDLGTSFVDLMLLHSPPPIIPWGSTCGHKTCALAQAQWGVLSAFLKRGKARAIGVSNYCASCLQCLLSSDVTPHVNQIQYHVGMPGADPTGLLGFCRSHNIVPQAYSPLGNYQTHSLASSSHLARIGTHLNPQRTSAQVALGWIIQHGVPLVTASNSDLHLKQSISTFNMDIPHAVMASLDAWDGAREDPVRGACR